MMTKYWRIPFLMLTCGGVFFVFAKLLLAAPTVKSYTPDPFAFPESVPLPEWQQHTSETLDSSHPSEFGAQRYQYRKPKSDTALAIEMRYLRGNGEVKSYIGRYTEIATEPEIRNSDSGFYGLVTHEERAYLSTCIPPRGNSAFTAKQFQRNALMHDIRPIRAVKWWVGQQKLIDQRCLWVNLSTPIANGSVETAYERLEETWQPWLAWWQDYFPNP